MEHFLANDWDKRRAQKRGGHLTFLSWEELNSEERHRADPADETPPDQIYERHWALTVLDHATGQLQEEFAAAGKASLFAELKPFLTGGAKHSFAEAAARLRLSEAAAKMTVTRMRQRYAVLLRAQIAVTVARPEDIEDERRALLRALRE